MLIFLAALVPAVVVLLALALAWWGRGSFRLGWHRMHQRIRARREGGILYIQHQVFNAVWSGITRSLSGEPLVVKEVQLFVPEYLRTEVEQARAAIAVEVINEVYECRRILREDRCLRGDDFLDCPQHPLTLDFTITSSAATHKLSDVRAKVVVSDACLCLRSEIPQQPTQLEVVPSPEFYEPDGQLTQLGLA